MSTAYVRGLASHVVVAALAASSAGAAPRVAFVTSTMGNGDLSSWDETNLDGQAGGDQICQIRAGLASPPLDNPTSFRAWLSVPATDAYCHLFGFTGESPTCGAQNPNLNLMGPWVRTDGEPFAAVFADLVGVKDALLQPILFDENGNEVHGQIWTGTDQDGEELTNSTCGGWASLADNGAYGFSDRVARGWTYNSTLPCTDAKRLLCFEPGVGDRVAPPEVAGALAFVTSTTGGGAMSSWAETNSNGLTGADEICRVRAAAGFLPNSDSFVALLSTEQTDAVERLTYPGPYLRVDGYVLAASLDDLFSNSPTLRTGLDVTESGGYLGATADGVWTGSTSQGFPVASRCNDWTSSEVAPMGGMGGYGPINSLWISGSNNNCSNGQRLYCFSNVEILFWDNFERGNTSRWTNGTP